MINEKALTFLTHTTLTLDIDDHGLIVRFLIFTAVDDQYCTYVGTRINFLYLWQVKSWFIMFKFCVANLRPGDFSIVGISLCDMAND